MNEDIIQRIERAGVKQYRIAEVLGIDPTVFCRMLQKELTDTDRTNILHAINYLIANEETEADERERQNRLRRECKEYLNLTRMNVRDFCKQIKLSRETYYNWIDGGDNLTEDSQIKVRKYLGSKDAQDLISERKTYRHISDCAAITGLPSDRIKRLCKSGVASFRQQGNGHYFVNINELNAYLDKIVTPINGGALAFGDLDLDMDENWRPLLSANNPHEIFISERHEYANEYCVSNKGRIFNATTRRLLEVESDKDNYLHVNLNRGCNNVSSEYVHRLVAYLFCPNAHYKELVHHINGDKSDNRSSNLVWVTAAEHKLAHSLRDKSKSEYQDYIKRIKKHNKGKKLQRG